MAVQSWGRRFRQRALGTGAPRHHFALVMVAALAVSAADALQAQSAGKLSLAPKVGVAVPAGAIGEYADPGPAAGLRLGYELRPGVSLVADGEVNFLKGTNLHKGLPNGIWTPDMKAMRYIAGLEARLGSEETAPWSLLASLGAGASLFDTDSYRSATSNQTRTFEKTALTAAGGLELGYAISPKFEVVADGRLYWSFLDKDETEDLAAISPSRLDPFSSAITLPLTIAVRTRV